MVLNAVVRATIIVSTAIGMVPVMDMVMGTVMGMGQATAHATEKNKYFLHAGYTRYKRVIAFK